MFRCEESLCSSLNIQNCLDHLITADLHNATKLKILVIKFVVENAQVDFKLINQYIPAISYKSER